LKLPDKKNATQLKAFRNVTGNVPESEDENNDCPRLSELEERIVGLLGDDIVIGIQGGVDTAEEELLVSKVGPPLTSQSLFLTKLYCKIGPESSIHCRSQFREHFYFIIDKPGGDNGSACVL
jgi:hypothetical protein